MGLAPKRDLETTKQGAHETFSAYITRWRQKASRMTDRPNEEDQIQLVVKNLLPVYHKHLFAHYFPNFKALIGAGTQVEDAINDGTIKTEEVRSCRTNFVGKNNAEVNAITQPIQPFYLNDVNPPRQFTDLFMPLERVLEKLISRDLLKPLDPRPPPNPYPRTTTRMSTVSTTNPKAMPPTVVFAFATKSKTMTSKSSHPQPVQMSPVILSHLTTTHPLLTT